MSAGRSGRRAHGRRNLLFSRPDPVRIHPQRAADPNPASSMAGSSAACLERRLRLRRRGLFVGDLSSRSAVNPLSTYWRPTSPAGRWPGLGPRTTPHGRCAATTARLADQYFRRRADRFALDERFRQRVNFEYLNLGPGSLSVAGERHLGHGPHPVPKCAPLFRPRGRPPRRPRPHRIAGRRGVLITGASDPLYQNEGGSEISSPSRGFYRRDLSCRQPAKSRRDLIDYAPRALADPPVADPIPQDGWSGCRRGPLGLEPAAAPDPVAAARRSRPPHGDHRRVIALTRNATEDPEP